VIRASSGDPVVDQRAAASVNIPPIAILPQIGPLIKEETVLQKEYVLKSMSTYLTSQHFRNELRFNPQFFQRFKELAETTWHGLRIEDFEGRTAVHGEALGLLIRDGGFTAEVGWMGHGLQMWDGKRGHH
jgi:hypothetical protein